MMGKRAEYHQPSRAAHGFGLSHGPCLYGIHERRGWVRYLRERRDDSGAAGPLAGERILERLLGRGILERHSRENEACHAAACRTAREGVNQTRNAARALVPYFANDADRLFLFRPAGAQHLP